MPDTHDEAHVNAAALRVDALVVVVDDLREQLAAATAELGRVNRRADFLDDALKGLRQQAIEAVKARIAATARAKKAEARLAEANGRADKFCGAFSDAGSLAYRRGKLLDAALTRQTELAKERDELRARLVELGDPAPEYGLQYGSSDPQALRAQDEIAYYQRQRHSGLRVRDVYRSQWRLAPETGCRSCGTTERVAGDPPLCSNCAVYGATYRGVACWPPVAAQDGLSATEADADMSGGAFQANTSSILPQGLSEVEDGRDTSAWCWAPNPHGPLPCGRLRDHEPPHRRGDRTWIDDDTTEDGRHG